MDSSLHPDDVIQVYGQLQSVTKLTDSSVWLAATAATNGGRRYVQIGAPVRHDRQAIEVSAESVQSFEHDPVCD